MSLTMAAFRISAFNFRNFRLYFIGQAISMSGTWMQRVAQGWLIYKLTGSEFGLGLAAFAFGLPSLLLMPVAGVLADRYPRRLLLTITQIFELGIAILLAYLTLTDRATYLNIGLLALFSGITTAFSEPVRQSILRELIIPEALGSAITLNSLMINVAAFVGPMLGGILLVTVGPGPCFLLNAISYLAVIACLLLIRPVNDPRSPQTTALAGLFGGWRYARDHNIIAPLLLVAALMHVLGLGVLQTLLPAFAAALNSPDAGYSAMSAAIGCGSILSALLTQTLRNRFGRSRVIVVAAVLWSALTIITVAGLSLPFVIALTGILGFTYTSFFVNVNVTIQAIVKDEFRGRVLALWSWSRYALAPLSGLVIGLIAQELGTGLTMFLCALLGGVSILIVLVATRDRVTQPAAPKS